MEIINTVILIGRLVRDPELKFIPNTGKAVVNYTLAIDRNLSREKKAELTEKGQPTADFIRVIAWGKLAETCANYLAKGRMVAVQGSIQTGSYKTNTGETRYSTDVIANSVEFLQSGSDKPKEETDETSFNGYNLDDFQAIEDDEDIPF